MACSGAPAPTPCFCKKFSSIHVIRYFYVVVSEFERGLLDIFTLFFGSLMLAVFHAVLQEYVIDVSTVLLFFD